MANPRKTKAYQTALADITAVIENELSMFGAQLNQSIARSSALRAVEEFIDSQSNMSESYRGYWIEHTRNKSGAPLDCFDVYLRQSDVGQINHWACEKSLDIARKVIDGYKVSR